MSDLIVATATVAPWWAQYAGGVVVALIGSGAILSESIRKLKSGFGKAEARKINSEAAINETTAASLNASRSADFERMLNERTFKNMDMLADQVKHLSELVEAQSAQITAQSKKMDHMEKEIVSLRQALDVRTNELNKVKQHFPPVCRNCEFFDPILGCTTKAEHCKLITPGALQGELPLNPATI